MAMQRAGKDRFEKARIFYRKYGKKTLAKWTQKVYNL
jgi:hypothetical protein